MRTDALEIPGSFVFTPETYRDERGFFVTPMLQTAFEEAAGHGFDLAQTNFNRSARHVLRGVHYTVTPPGQAKYVYCAHGRVLDVVIDLRVGSPAFGRWSSVELDSASCRSVYLPVGVGHAFLALEKDSVMSYLVSTAYRPELELSIDPFDEELALPWPAQTSFTVSERDRAAISFATAREKDLLPRYEDCEAVVRGAR